MLMAGDNFRPAMNSDQPGPWRTWVAVPRILSLTLALVAAAPAASAHSLHELETELGDREKYFQPIDKNAPGFTLQDADGRSLSLVDFRGKVAVLHFIYTSCPDVCPL